MISRKSGVSYAPIRPYFEDGIFYGVEVIDGKHHFLLSRNEYYESSWEIAMVHTVGTDYYIPKYDEMKLMSKYRSEINKILESNLCNSLPLAEIMYWTSEESSDKNAVAFNFHYKTGSIRLKTEMFPFRVIKKL